MAARFNPPPGWPPAPEGWTPPPGWNPDPSWPPAPPGWQLWLDESAPGAPTPDVARFSGGDAAATQAFPAQGGPGSNDPSKTSTFQPGSFGGPPPAGPGAPGFGGPGAPGGWQQPGQPGDGAPKGNKGWLIPVIIGVVALLAILGILFATGVFGGDDEPEKDPTTKSEKSKEPTDEPTDEDTDEPTEEPTDEDTDEPTEEPTDEETDDPKASGDTGTRSSPLAVDEVAILDDWSVTLSASNLDAWAEMSADLDDFDLDYYAPAEGVTYVLAPASVQYLGDDRSDLYSLQFVYVGGNGSVYDERCMYSFTGSLDISQELYTDASASGSVCVAVPTEEVAGGVWRVSADYSGDYEAYYATQ